MRQATAQALHHAAHRMAFQKRLVDQSLMRNVLADLAIEVEAATVVVMRIAGAFDRASIDVAEQNFGRLATPIAKYWMGQTGTEGDRRSTGSASAANGYVEESILPRALSGSAGQLRLGKDRATSICLDVLRAIDRSPEALEALVSGDGGRSARRQSPVGCQARSAGEPTAGLATERRAGAGYGRATRLCACRRSAGSPCAIRHCRRLLRFTLHRRLAGASSARFRQGSILPPSSPRAQPIPS